METDFFNRKPAEVRSRALKYNTALDDRPREKALKQGFDTLTPAELFAIIIGSGSRGESVVDLCQRILNDHNNKIYQIARLSPNDLMRMYHGVGEVKALQILAAIEIARRFQGEEFDNEFQIISNEDAYRYLSSFMLDKRHEELWILTLDRAKHVTAKVMISSGGTSATVGDVKMIMKAAVENLADSIILAHNHPSNNPRPSTQDDDLTRKVSDAGKVMDIPLLDHIIVCRGAHYSYRQSGKL